MNGKKLAVIAAVAVSIIVAGVLVASSGVLTGPAEPENTPPASTEGPRNFVVNVTDSVELQDR